MVTIRRANVVLDVKDDQVDYYVNQGYDVIDSTNGGVIKKSTPKDVSTLTKAYHDHIEKIEQLEAKIKEQETEIKKLKKAKKAGSVKKDK